jgi:uncharacterized protein (DUF2252 family)
MPSKTSTPADSVIQLPTQPAVVEKGKAAAKGKIAAPIPHPSVTERRELGRLASLRTTHEAHAEFTPAADRDPIGLLESQAGARVPELVPIRYGRMMLSPFAFYRGAALVMAHDLAGTPTSGLQVQLCGDAHLSNFGIFGSPERRLVFDINDFDETCPGPWEWDLKRLLASFAIGAREIGIPGKKRRDIVRTVSARYRTAMAEFAGMRDLDVWYAHADVANIYDNFAQQLRAANRKKVDKTITKAMTRDSMQALTKLTKVVDGERRIISSPPLISGLEDLFAGEDGDQLRHDRDQLRHWMHELIRSYRRTLNTDRRHLLQQYRFVDIARKVVGVGSVGTRCWIILLLGRDDDDPLFLQAKEAGPSVLTAVGCKSEFGNQGQRVVAGQRLMQATSDIFLGWQRTPGLMDGIERDFYIRQLRDWKGSVELEGADATGMRAYGELCAWTLARGHARSGDRIAISSYLGDSLAFDDAMVAFAEAYADQNERDHAALVDAVKSGRLVAQQGL